MPEFLRTGNWSVLLLPLVALPTSYVHLSVLCVSLSTVGVTSHPLFPLSRRIGLLGTSVASFGELSQLYTL